MLVLDRPAANPDNQVHILGHGIEGEPTCLDHCLAMKHRERARNDHRAAHQVPSRPAKKETAQVFDHLKALHSGRRQPHLRHLTVPHFAAVQDPDDPSTGHKVERRGDDRPH